MYTKRFIYYRKAVLHLLKRMFHVRVKAGAVQICGKFWDFFLVHIALKLEDDLKL